MNIYYGKKKKKKRRELPRLYLGQIKFFQFKRESVRDSIKDLEAACGFALGSHPCCSITVTKKPVLAPSSHSGLWTLAGMLAQQAVPGQAAQLGWQRSAGSPPWPP